VSYFIFKNIDSRDVKGLIVSELPPITKPKMRVRVDTIDGKDGADTVNLGFEAYTKTVKIGLTRGYDIDNIIAWLHGDGDIQFSNEPDKYYRVKVHDQIDFERLLRFRTAEIKFYTQPFKYSATERVKSLNVSGLATAEIRNAGNYFSKPAITFMGTGTVNVSVNGSQKCVLYLGATSESITLDTDKQEAYSGLTLKNRQMDGEFITLEVGKNTITWTGNLTKIDILHYSRWL
jgi:predicted phage tail component-like protein